MTDQIDCYFTSPSPFHYLGLQQLMDVASKHGKSINYKPFNLMGVWSNSGAVMPAERPAVRQRYRLIELQRVAHDRGISLNAKPAFFPTNPAPADHAVCALVEAGIDPSSFCLAVGKALWAEEKNIGDEDVVSALLGECGHDAEAIMAAAGSDEVAAIRQKNTKEAVAADAVGAPAYVYNGEVFWGQDRIDALDNMIASGRAAFTSD